MMGADYLEPAELAQVQQQRLQCLLQEILPGNRFYGRKLAEAGLKPADLRTLDDWRRLPFTTKAEILADQQQHPPCGQLLTYPPERYRRLHQTSGSRGQPLRWLDTPESWEWMLGCWAQVYRFAGLTSADRLFFAFSFGPFLGFWTAFEAGNRLGCLCLPGGGLSSVARLRLLLDHQATVLLCTPTYALRLAEVARQQGISLSKPAQAVRALIVAGEPGGSIPATRARIEEAWQARVFDHAGLTEVGPLAIECQEQPGGLHILEGDYWAEVVDPANGQPAPPGQVGELVATNLGRWGSPLLRYRTGDLVRVDPRHCPCGRTFRRLDGGILGRCDDMIHLRGNNVYPSALEGVIRRFAEVAEYRLEVDQSASLANLRIELEPVGAAGDLAGRVSQAIRDELLFRADVVTVPPGSLPRFDMKAKRIHHKDTKNTKETRKGGKQT